MVAYRRVVARPSSGLWCTARYVIAAHMICLVLSAVEARAQVTFTPLGVFGGVSSGADDVSADGTVVVGRVFTLPDSSVSVFRWSAQQSTVRPTGIRRTEFTDSPISISPDGSTVVGTYLSRNGPEAFRWMSDGMFEGLGDLSGGAFESQPFDVSVDGRVVVGKSQTETEFKAFQWTPEQGMVELEGGIAHGISPTGTIIVGGSPAFRWTAETGSVILPPLPVPQFRESGATAISANGSVIVGFNTFGRLTLFQDEAFRWTAQSGTVSLQSLPWTDTQAFDVSGDGSAIVGTGVRSGQHWAFYWTPETGMLDLQILLISLGVTNLDGWQLNSAEAISQDGLTIVGSGFHNNRSEACVATIPEPSTLMLAALGALVLLAPYLRQRFRQVFKVGR